MPYSTTTPLTPGTALRASAPPYASARPRGAASPERSKSPEARLDALEAERDQLKKRVDTLESELRAEKRDRLSWVSRLEEKIARLEKLSKGGTAPAPKPSEPDETPAEEREKAALVAKLPAAERAIYRALPVRAVRAAVREQERFAARRAQREELDAEMGIRGGTVVRYEGTRQIFPVLLPSEARRLAGVAS